ncbi:hypothetical protein ASG29_08440 [Sphingomonas sp. Leaf412]|uniref:winged helix DNA-binding protein n=1 Tax=Sphingomonas sp. Leaf412 TaxID=1736370 RepID=UPI0006FA58A1|nr:winged helix DNA-binding protein [Sphingomonas sp. Leaf412]KQT31902.1 hypothetical protein ASG29_08440 [Sphingomonas sp. Leaf412]
MPSYIAPGEGGAPFLLATVPGGGAEAEAAIRLIGGTVVHRVALADAADACAGFAGAVVIDVRDADEGTVHAATAALDAAAAAHDLPLIVAMSLSQVDVVVAALRDGDPQLLCDPDQAEWVRALVTAGLSPRSGGSPGGVRDPGDEAERLARLQAEVARIADALSRLGTDRDAPRAASDARPRFDAGPVAASITAPEVRDVIKARRLRDRFLGEGLFEDPAWDMLLDLFAAELEGARVSVSSLCIAAAVAPTTALRWIGRLTDTGLLERAPDPQDRRRAFVALSPIAGTAMRGYVAATKAAGLPLV